MPGISCAAVLALGLLLSACGGGGGGGQNNDNGLPVTNVAPVASAGVTQSGYTASTVTLDGSASTDANADPLTYKWSFTSKPVGSSATLSSTTAVKPTFVADLAGSYVLSLVVSDGKLDSSNPATVTITITASVLNLAPVANAGPAQNVFTNTVVTLTGAASTDGNGDALTYAWTLSAKPTGSAAVLANATTVAPSFTADKVGTYTASLIVNDGKVNSTVATVTITASILNVAPVANAGTAQNVTTTTLVTLDGSASVDANGDTLTYTWSLTTKPSGSTAVLSSTSAVKPTFTADKAGSYVAQLLVYDGQATSNPATVTITAAVLNVAPVANAGTAQTVATAATVILDGSASSDANGDTLTYAWVLSSKPSGSAATLNSATAQKPTFTADLAGSYVAQLVVNDGKVKSSNTANVTITATAPNVAPVANAGTAQTVMEGDPVWLSGLASSDANGDTLTYAWTLTSVPTGSTAALSDATTHNTELDPDVSGTYIAQLIVNDGKLSSPAVTVTIVVNPYYTKLDAAGLPLAESATSWSCVRDNRQKLVWEVKNMTDLAHLRYYRNKYTNYDGQDPGQYWNGSSYVNPTQAQIDARTNSIGFKKAVNAQGLCGATDWRLPDLKELKGLVFRWPSPHIKTTFFPDVDQTVICGYACDGYFWTSDPANVTFTDGAAVVGFTDPYGVTDYDRAGANAVRLVRSGQ